MYNRRYASLEGTARPQDRKTARLQDRKTARLQDCKTIRPARQVAGGKEDVETKTNAVN